MIQSTSRLSRGARQRRAKPWWPIIIVALGVALLGALLLLLR
jgi:uncharacterized integral membrane protein